MNPLFSRAYLRTNGFGSYLVTSGIAKDVVFLKHGRQKQKQRDSSEGRRSVVKPTSDLTPIARDL